MLKEDMTVRKIECIARDVYLMVLHGAVATKLTAPGQFVHIRCGDGWETLLRRPISIATWDETASTITIVFRAEGAGTRWLAERKAGDAVDVLGPLGNGFPLTDKPGQKSVIIGGGVGVPPLYGLAQALNVQGVTLDIRLGFASRADAFFVDDFSILGATEVATDDGTLGHQGLVTELLPDPEAWDGFYACGPFPMLRALQQVFDPSGVPGYLSLEQRMGCGIGTCLACVCPTQAGEQVKICSDGPVFSYREVVL